MHQLISPKSPSARFALFASVLVSSSTAFAQGTSILVSANASGTAPSGGYGNCAISDDGRWLAFASPAGDIVPGDTNGVNDIFLRDTSTATTTRVSVSELGNQLSFESLNPALSSTGRFVVFYTAPLRVNFRDLATNSVENVNVSSTGTAGNLPAQTDFAYAVTPDGRFVAFASYASNIVPGDTNGKADIFVRDRVLGTTELASIGSAGEPANGYSVKTALSADGRFVAFESYANNLVSHDANAWGDAFVRDRLLGVTERVSINNNGFQGNLGGERPSMSADGRFIAFESLSSNLVPNDTNSLNDVFVFDRSNGTTEIISRTAFGLAVGGVGPSITADGRFVAFASDSAQLVAGDNNGHQDVFVADRWTGGMHMVGRNASGDFGNGDSREAAISGDGRRVAFASLSSNLAPADGNQAFDFFFHDIAPATPVAYCTGKTNSLGCLPTISASGTASTSLAAPFAVSGQALLNQRAGYLFYGLGSASGAYMGGTLCVAVPLRRTPGQNSGGSAAPANDCSGVLSFDFNTRIQSGIDPALVAGSVLNVQWAYRDPADPYKIGFTDALQFVISN